MIRTIKKYFKYLLLTKLTCGKKKIYYKHKLDKYNLRYQLDRLNHQVQNMEYEFADKFNLSNSNVKIPKIMTLEETIDDIIKNKKSVCRFGDGEFRYLLGEEKIKKYYFGTDFNPVLQKRLIEVLMSNEPNLLVCLWAHFGALDDYTELARESARRYMNKFRKGLEGYLSFDKYYGNANITRPYLTYHNKNVAVKLFNKIKELWQDRDIVIVEGIYSKLGVNNDLFSGAKSISRVLCPSENAWGSYEEIKKAVSEIPKDKLILIALGMTATVLAYDLAKIGYWAIDIGHIDIEYEWYLNNVAEPIQIKGKYTNDIAPGGGGINSQDLPTDMLPEYKQQVITVIK